MNIRRTKTISKKSRALRIGIFAVTGAVAIAYFFQITIASSRGYQLKKLSDQEHALNQEMRDLDLQVAQQSSAEQLQQRVAALGMQPATHVEYVSAEANSVALK